VIRPLRERSQTGDPGILSGIPLIEGNSLSFWGHDESVPYRQAVIYATILLFLLIGITYTHIFVGMNALLFKHMPKGRHGEGH
jgi:hypothetical protein